MQRISPDQFGRQVPCNYRGERYVIRDNGAVCRKRRPNMRQRPHDEIWTFGKPCATSGYMKVSTHAVHRVVATGFLGEPPSETHVVDHIDTNRRNNRPQNLRWVTRMENILLNPITSRRIIDAYGSIEAFLDNPTKSERGSLEPNFAWMKAVSSKEAQSSLDRMLAWARREELGSAETLGNWVQRRGFPKERLPQAFQGEPLTKPSLTVGAAQRKWREPTEFPLCPYPAARDGLQAYAMAISIGGVFSRNRYGDVLVEAVGWTPDGSGLLVLGLMPPNAQKPWALAQITLEDGIFVHANCGSFFEDEGAQKYFVLAQGREWAGGDTFDDYC